MATDEEGRDFLRKQVLTSRNVSGGRWVDAVPGGLNPLGTLRPLEALLDLLLGAGFDGRGALHAYRLYIDFLYGRVLNELQERVHDPDESDDLLRLGLYRLPVREFPRLRGLAGELAGYDGERELDEGLDVMLAGLRSRTTPELPTREGRDRDATW